MQTSLILCLCRLFNVTGLLHAHKDMGGVLAILEVLKVVWGYIICDVIRLNPTIMSAI